MISLETFASQYLDEHQRGAAIAALDEHKDSDRPLAEWRSLWQKALNQPVQ
jgi:CelD/BcsL family acetyltransferase involved in cellulose biosynthesis